MNAWIPLIAMAVTLHTACFGEQYRPTHNLGEFVRELKRAYEEQDAEWLQSAVDREGIVAEEKPYYDFLLTPKEDIKVDGEFRVRLPYQAHSLKTNSRAEIEIEPTIPIDFVVEFRFGEQLDVELPCGYRDGKIYICGIRNKDPEQDPREVPSVKSGSTYQPTDNVGEFIRVYQRAVYRRDIPFLESMVDDEGEMPCFDFRYMGWIHPVGGMWRPSMPDVEIADGELGPFTIASEFSLRLFSSRIIYSVPCGYKEGKIFICGIKDRSQEIEDFEETRWYEKPFTEIDGSAWTKKKTQQIFVSVELENLNLEAAVDHLHRLAYELDAMELDERNKGVNMVIREAKVGQRQFAAFKVVDKPLNEVLDRLAKLTRTKWCPTDYGVVFLDGHVDLPTLPSAVFEKLENIVIPEVDLEDMTLDAARDMLSSLSEKSDYGEIENEKKGIKIDAPEESIAEKKIYRLRLRNVSLYAALRAVALAADVRLVIEGDTVRFISNKEGK